MKTTGLALAVALLFVGPTPAAADEDDPCESLPEVAPCILEGLCAGGFGVPASDAIEVFFQRAKTGGRFTGIAVADDGDGTTHTSHVFIGIIEGCSPTEMGTHYGNIGWYQAVMVAAAVNRPPIDYAVEEGLAIACQHLDIGCPHD